MAAIQVGGSNIVLAVDDSGVLIGEVTGGDGRRAFLDGYELSDRLN
jgi:hypothetical protein